MYPHSALSLPEMPRHYRPGLDVLRLAALLPVLCYHYCIEAARLGFAVPTALISRGMADWVELGLAWFFLLSGAALCLQWQGRFALRRYLAGRAAATYPAFWLGFAALFLYGEVLHGNNAGIPRWRVIFSLLGLDGYLTPVTVTFYKIGEWFLGVILILYLVFPLLLWCMETQLRRRVLAVCMAVLAIVWPLICPAPWEAGHTVLGRLPAFALGVWFGSLLQKDAAPPKWLAAGLLMLPLLWVTAVPRLAVLLAVAAGRLRVLELLLWPYVTAIKSVPVASFIIICLIWMSTRQLAVFISFLMVFPVIYSNTLQGIKSADGALLEMARVYRVPFSRRLGYIYAPQVKPFLLSGCSVALGMSWKSGVAAEVIGVVGGSIGERLYEAKVYFQMTDLLAWTVVIVVCSVGFEKLVLWLLRRCFAAWEGR